MLNNYNSTSTVTNNASVNLNKIKEITNNKESMAIQLKQHESKTPAANINKHSNNNTNNTNIYVKCNSCYQNKGNYLLPCFCLCCSLCSKKITANNNTSNCFICNAGIDFKKIVNLAKKETFQKYSFIFNDPEQIFKQGLETLKFQKSYQKKYINFLTKSGEFNINNYKGNGRDNSRDNTRIGNKDIEKKTIINNNASNTSNLNNYISTNTSIYNNNEENNNDISEESGNYYNNANNNKNNNNSLVNLTTNVKKVSPKPNNNQVNSINQKSLNVQNLNIRTIEMTRNTNSIDKSNKIKQVNQSNSLINNNQINNRNTVTLKQKESVYYKTPNPLKDLSSYYYKN